MFTAGKTPDVRLACAAGTVHGSVGGSAFQKSSYQRSSCPKGHRVSKAMVKTSFREQGQTKSRSDPVKAHPLAPPVQTELSPYNASESRGSSWSSAEAL